MVWSFFSSTSCFDLFLIISQHGSNYSLKLPLITLDQETMNFIIYQLSNIKA